jgi:ATP-dependent Clp protease ATP-binding subunit ClpC
VGKTELARALAEYLFGTEEALIKLDMSEYMEKYAVSRMVGAPPGYVGYEEGGQLTEKVRRHPYCVVLFDEIEKAHPDVFSILLQIMDDGRLTDAQGRQVDFRHSIVILTSNLATSSVIARPFGFRLEGEEIIPYEEMKKQLMAEVKKNFRPEFLNRLDEIIIFHSLKPEHIKRIVDLMIAKISLEIKSKKLDLVLTESARDFLAREGFDPTYGARPLRRTIQHLVENPLSEKILEGEFQEGDTVIIDCEGSSIVFHRLIEAVPTVN